MPIYGMGFQRLIDLKLSNQEYPLHWDFFFLVKSLNHEDKNQTEKEFFSTRWLSLSENLIP